MYDRRIVYADNAASSFPKPQCVIRAVVNSLKRNAANPGRSGHVLSVDAARTVYEARCAAGEFFDCDENGIIFTQNATHALNILIMGALCPGNHVLISDMEHNSVLRPLTALKQRGTVTFDVVSTDGDYVLGFERAIRPNTRMIICTHASNVTGRLFDVARIASVAKRRGVLFAVDASQSAGYADLRMRRDHIDFLCTAGHKGLLAPQGSGILAINCEVPVSPLTYGGTGTESLSALQPPTLPEALEAGTLCTPAIAGLKAALGYLMHSHSELQARERRLIGGFIDGLSQIDGVRIYEPAAERVPTVSFNLKGYDSEQVASMLDRSGICVRGGWHCSALAHGALGTAGVGAVRVSFGPFNTEADARRILKCIRDIKKI